ncbi:hypothetical protein WS67_12585 [Burkholderia singularis]|uniref:Uncharacterized protein n=1 Tax=Burkholderia singularis TaxID=1503053 RepID=A0A103E2S8_9BURK|nr:hypothetical protein WS67_12585 [Burkholderia singularis]
MWLRTDGARLRDSAGEISRNRVVKFRTSSMTELIRFRFQKFHGWVSSLFVSRMHSECSNYARPDAFPVPGWTLW